MEENDGVEYINAHCGTEQASGLFAAGWRFQEKSPKKTPKKTPKAVINQRYRQIGRLKVERDDLAEK